MTTGGATYYYQLNAHGDVVSLTNSSGQVVNSYSYDPWGKVLSASETVPNPYRYASYRYDATTGLYYLFKRYYSPAIYRFLTKDIDRGDLRNPKSLNSYVYVGDNPANVVDPTGLFWDAISGFASSALGAAADVIQSVDWAAVAVGADVVAFGAGAVASYGAVTPGGQGLATVATWIGLVATGFSLGATTMALATGQMSNDQAIASYLLGGGSFIAGAASVLAPWYLQPALSITSANLAFGNLGYNFFMYLRENGIPAFAVSGGFACQRE